MMWCLVTLGVSALAAFFLTFFCNLWAFLAVAALVLGLFGGEGGGGDDDGGGCGGGGGSSSSSGGGNHRRDRSPHFIPSPFPPPPPSPPL